MPLKAINDSDLSDAECPALKGKPSATPKPKPEPKKLQLPMKAKSAAKPKAAPAALPSQQEPTAPEQTKVANVLKRPAAAKANPSTAEGPPHKKPAAAKATKKPPTGRAYKYYYHQKEMYGIKRDGSELCTVKLEPGLTMDEICDIAEAIREEAEKGAAKADLIQLAATMKQRKLEANAARTGNALQSAGGLEDGDLGCDDDGEGAEEEEDEEDPVMES